MVAEKQSNKPDTSRKRPSRRLKLFLLIIVAVVVIGIGIAHTLNSPANGKIASEPDSAQAAKVSPPHYTGRLLSFDYPADYSKLSSQRSGSFLQVALFNSQTASKQISVGVIKESLANDSGANYRIQHAKIYHEHKTTNGLIFTASQTGAANDFERTIYISHDQLVASISLSGTDASMLTSDSEVITQSLAWKQ